MAVYKLAKTDEEIKKLGVAAVRKEYIDLAKHYNSIIERKFLYCYACDEFHPVNSFYKDKRFAIGLYPECKKALLQQASDYDRRTETYIDNKDKLKAVLQKINRPFIESLYKASIEAIQTEGAEKVRSTVFQQYAATIMALPQYSRLTWADSVFDPDETPVELVDNRTARKDIKTIFGSGFTESDYLYLQDQYDDWRSRTQLDTKSQETYVVQICLQLLDIYKDRRNNRDVSSKLKALDTLMNAANLQPKQNVSNAATDSLTFGQLIEKWENEKPIPEPAEEFKDVDGIGKYIRVWFSGWLAKAMGLRNAYTEECEQYINQYSVSKPEYVEDEEGSEAIYDRLFGNAGD